MKNEIKKRNFGIDMLKVVAMYMVLILHINGQGGLLEAVPKNSLQGQTVLFLEFSSFCAVNCFGIISGYLGLDGNFKLEKLLKLWAQMVFYCLLSTVYFNSNVCWFNAV